MHTTTPSPITFHPEQRLTQFQQMQRQLHAMAAQLRALYQPDPLKRMRRQHTHALDSLQQQFGHSVQIAAHRPSGARR